MKTEFDPFERRLASAIIADADEAIPGFDPANVSRAAIARGRRPGARLRSAASRLRRRGSWLRASFAPVGGTWVATTAVAVLAVAILALVAQPVPWLGTPSASPGMASPIVTAVPVAPPQGAWTDGGSMAEARSSGVVAAVLLDGRVLVVGGGQDLRSAELFDPATGTWIATGRTVEPRLHATVTVLADGRVLLTGGSSGRPPAPSGQVVTFAPTLATAELYDPGRGTWTATGTMSQARGGHTATLLPDGRVLVAGGAAPEQVPYPRFNSTEIYDPASGTWTAGPPMLVARDSHSATRLESGQVLVAGGHARQAGRLPSAELYDPATGAWVEAADLPEAFSGHGAALLGNGAVLVFGGDVPAGPGAVGSAHAALYDPASDSWAMAAEMATPRIGHDATVLANGDVLVTGGAAVGDPDPSPYGTTETYDPKSGSWTDAAPMAVPRTGHVSVLLLDGRVLVIGGSGGGNAALASTELFEP